MPEFSSMQTKVNNCTQYKVPINLLIFQLFLEVLRWYFLWQILWLPSLLRLFDEFSKIDELAKTLSDKCWSYGLKHVFLYWMYQMIWQGCLHKLFLVPCHGWWITKQNKNLHCKYFKKKEIQNKIGQIEKHTKQAQLCLR